jgi:integrase
MARPLTGRVIEREAKRGTTFALRFRAYGRRRFMTLGSTEEGWTRAQAEEELQNVIADVRRGIWREPEPPSVAEEPRQEQTFHEFASEWLGDRELEGLANKTIVDLRWSLSNHLLPHFADLRLSEITPRAIDRFKVDKVREREAIEAAKAKGEKIRERGLGNNSINHVLSDLAQVLETAVEYELIPSNPASGKRRRLKSTRPSRPWVEPEQLPALLDAASDSGRVLFAVLAGAGLRIGEALSVRWRHCDLAIGTLHVVDAKTAAGVRSVDLTPALREALTLRRAESEFTEPDHYILPTSTGAKHNPSNLRRDVLRPAIERANTALKKDGIATISEQLGFHGLRRTYASLRCAVGDDIAYTSGQLGHEDPRFTLRCYAQATKRRERLSGPHLRAYDRAIEWAQMGTIAVDEKEAIPTEATKNPA